MTAVAENAAEAVEVTEEVLSSVVAKNIAEEYKAAKGEVATVAKKAVTELEVVDKLLVSQLENSLLKIQVEIQQHQAELSRLNNLGKEVSEKYKNSVESLFKKYEISIETHILDVAEHAFKVRPKQNQ